MNETHPQFLINKYKSILAAAIIEEMVVFLISLTDSIVAGNLIDKNALMIVGLVAPILNVALFVTAVINGGTIRNYSYYIGSFKRERANEFFSLGVLASVGGGIIISLSLLLAREWYISTLSISKTTAELTRSYYNVILIYIALEPLSCVLDNIMISEGEERIAAAANILEICNNVVFSVIFAMYWGVAGVAMASVLSKVIFLVIVIGRLLRVKSGIRLIWHWNIDDFLIICNLGFVRASTFVFTALMTMVMNAYILNVYGNDILVILVMVEQYLGLSSLFLGVSMSIQSIIGTLIGEKNTKAGHYFMRFVTRVMAVFGLFVTLMTIIFAPLLVRLMGISSGRTYELAVPALRISCSTLFVQAIIILFFIYYYLRDFKWLALSLAFIKDFLFPLGLVLFLNMALDTSSITWFSLMLAPIASIIIGAAIVFILSKKADFPFMISHEHDNKIHIFGFNLDEYTIVEMSRTAEKLAKNYPDRIRRLLALYVEEMLMLILQKNKEADKTVNVECTLMLLDDSVRMIIRDSGIIFNLTDSDTLPDSFRQYIVSNMINALDNKAHIRTTGYNRNEFFFK